MFTRATKLLLDISIIIISISTHLRLVKSNITKKNEKYFLFTHKTIF